MYDYLDRERKVAERYRVMPSLFNHLLWRVIWQEEGEVHVAKVTVPWWSEGCIDYNTSLRLVTRERLIEEGVTASWGEVQWHDFNRFEHFADKWLVEHPADPDVWGDIRYSQLPGSSRMLWSIKMGEGDKHADMLRDRRDILKTAGGHVDSILDVVKHGCSR